MKIKRNDETANCRPKFVFFSLSLTSLFFSIQLQPFAPLQVRVVHCKLFDNLPKQKIWSSRPTESKERKLDVSWDTETIRLETPVSATISD
ncbi:hypothetical protein HYC85_002774 [Camellia sinensis]|uniref:Uncharacterized protein n=1 Tax=Camellia sinensis TaxID=4442 RepID=A0A7J7I9N8_CAMSI|nr:hypothetical protein HYC85_002774 [Camellia sinensis]